MSIARKIITGDAGGASDPTYVDDVFSTYLFNGTDAPHPIVNGIDLDEKGGLVWTKVREGPDRSHELFDTERGPLQELRSDTSEASRSSGNTLTSFNSDGFTVAGNLAANVSGRRGVSWTFAKQKGFFDVVTYTGDSVAGREIPHNLGSAPGIVIVKSTTRTDSWAVYHRSLGNQYELRLDRDTAKDDDVKYWNYTDPTSTVFTVGTDYQINGAGEEYVAYLFAHDAQEFGPNSDESIIKCGSYIGNGIGLDIDLGWEPQWLLVKSTTTAASWYMQDIMRGFATVPSSQKTLKADGTDAESGGGQNVLVTTTGFRVQQASSGFNQTGDEYIYMAIRRPHKPAEEFEPEELFAMDVTASGDFPMVVSGFPVDMGWLKKPNVVDDNHMGARLIPGRYVRTNSANAGISDSNFTYDYQEGFIDNWNRSSQAWMFRRAPGFFDVVTQEGEVQGVFKHNLGVPPELILLKTTEHAAFWIVYAEPAGDGTLFLSEAAYNPGQNGWLATDTTFTTAGGLISPTRPYIAFLWASVPGICDIGSYTGTGSNLDVDCGFTNGARFVLIKRTDDTGDWYYWDTLRGIITGSDPYLLLNSDAAPPTYEDFIDPLSSGFTVTSSAPAALNNIGGEYIYMAIA